MYTQAETEEPNFLVIWIEFRTHPGQNRTDRGLLNVKCGVATDTLTIYSKDYETYYRGEEKQFYYKSI